METQKSELARICLIYFWASESDRNLFHRQHFIISWHCSRGHAFAKIMGRCQTPRTKVSVCWCGRQGNGSPTKEPRPSGVFLLDSIAPRAKLGLFSSFGSSPSNKRETNLSLRQTVQSILVLSHRIFARSLSVIIIDAFRIRIKSLCAAIWLWGNTSTFMSSLRVRCSVFMHFIWGYLMNLVYFQI